MLEMINRFKNISELIIETSCYVYSIIQHKM